MTGGASPARLYPFFFPVRASSTRGRLSLAESDQPREEPSAGKPPARICRGEAEWPSYPTIPTNGESCAVRSPRYNFQC
jgi:hypothetical protein